MANKLQFVEHNGKAATVTWCLLCDHSFGLCGFLSSHSFWMFEVCVLVPDYILNLLHMTAIKETTLAASFVHSPHHTAHRVCII